MNGKNQKRKDPDRPDVRNYIFGNKRDIFISGH